MQYKCQKWDQLQIIVENIGCINCEIHEHTTMIIECATYMKVMKHDSVFTENA